ncbi:signal recognition particle-docking protein FtsY [Kangiella koreensis]|uniref:Signal recognition particle receptor FtsY n=1 Tax=Kangiella koreensis (strain DSM 16069 / JCM 12317 / KCTC 12182 / SW-125) TaxID=523791 RepID=C7R9V5_KANKD|nr:signal recognition particle-docking protein FtsY [Kangiella koreensis]ACV27974.1 signal recognition particle-docking protein FtsY [Kangiella koreensis DSM 16069]
MSDSQSKDKSKRGLFGWFGKKDSNNTEQSPDTESETPIEESAAEEQPLENSTPKDQRLDEELLEQAEHALEEQLEEQVEHDIEEAYEHQEHQGEKIEAAAPTLTDPNQQQSNDHPAEKQGFFSRLKAGLSRTRGQLADSLANLVLGSKEIDDDLLEDIETQLLMADVGVSATRKIIDDLTDKAARKELKDPQALMDRLRQLLSEIIEPCTQPLELTHKPFVILMVGVNGVGKTTTIGKLAKKFQGEGKSVMLAAGDTFRAAAVEQLQVWGERNNIHVTAQHTGADSASVIFDALQAAQARKIDVLIADTAGRLHTKSNLMDELSKVQRVMQKLDPSAPHEVMLVVDAGTGQNALNQAEHFNKAVPLSGITITKLDGTAKGGIIFALADKMKTPIRFIGVGEGIDDLREFNGQDFIQALFATDDNTQQ